MTQASPQARLTLSDAFQRFEATVSPDDRRLFNDTTLEDVRNEALGIEKQLRARGTYRNMARMQPFLRGMEHYAKVVEVLCNGTDYLSWIWAPVKLMLMLSVDFLDAFEKLIDAYGKIADMLPRFDRLAGALSYDHNFQALLALVYADILEFHRRAYKFVRKKSWAIFFKSMWSGFESRFGAILRNLAYHSDLVQKEAVSVDIADTVARGQLDEERWEQQEREWRAQKNHTVLSWLSTNDTPPEDILERHVHDCVPGSCDWFLDHQKMKSWLDGGASNALLWMYGKPGAGKSIICSNIVQHAASTGTNVFYYFCSYLDDTSANSSHLLRSLVTQIVQKHQDLGIHVYENYCQAYSVPTQKALLGLLLELLQGLVSVRIVVDGIDEWAISEQRETLRNLAQLTSKNPSSYICKILIASRETLEISRILRKKGSRATSISLSDQDESDGINKSIAILIENRLAHLPDHFSDLDPDLAALDKVKQTLLLKSNGMFLWVRLVLDSLDAVYSSEELGSIVDDLPSDLDALYNRILERLCNASGTTRYGGVLEMLGWICFARRPLHKVEILHGLAMRPAEDSSAPLDVPIPQLLDHCKPLIEERADSTIVFVHFSIPEFLLRSKAGERVSQKLSQLNISYACTSALLKGFTLLDPQTTLPEYLTSIASGTHRLLPYALRFWVAHCLDYAKCGGIFETNRPLPRLLRQLHRKHDQLLQVIVDRDLSDSQSLGFAEVKDMEDYLELLHHLPIHQLLHDVLKAQHKISQHPYEDSTFTSQHDRTLFSDLTTRFETSVLDLLTRNDVDGIPQRILEEFKKSYSSIAFRCRYPSCPEASTGFASQEQRIAHETTHFYRMKCEVQACQWSRIGFKNKAGLNAHNRKYHNAKSTSLIPPSVRRPVKRRYSTAPILDNLDNPFQPDPAPHTQLERSSGRVPTSLVRTIQLGGTASIASSVAPSPQLPFSPTPHSPQERWTYYPDGRVDAPWPQEKESPSVPPPPPWLQEALQELKQKYPDISLEATMRYKVIREWSMEEVEPGSFTGAYGLPIGHRAQYVPKICCLDCPSKLYDSGPEQTITNFQTHLDDKQHKHNVEKRKIRELKLVGALDRFGASRLARESERGDLSTVKAAYKADPVALDVVDFAGIAPLQKAALNGWADIVEYLIDQGCRTDCASSDQDTPLIDAVENGHLDVVKVLLNKGHVNVSHRNKKGQRAIDVLDPDDENVEDIEKELKAAMQRGSDALDNPETSQSRINQAKAASRLLYNEYNTETLVEKAANGDILAVGELINSNVKPNLASGAAAARGGHYDILSILLASGLKADFDPLKHNDTPMVAAIGRGHLKVIKLLLEQENFDPTRRSREGKAYWEISHDRRGPKWEQERDILKTAYEDFERRQKGTKRKSSLPNRDEPEDTRVTESSATFQAPEESRRLISGKEMANENVANKRRRRVVDDKDDDERDLLGLAKAEHDDWGLSFEDL